MEHKESLERRSGDRVISGIDEENIESLETLGDVNQSKKASEGYLSEKTAEGDVPEKTKERSLSHESNNRVPPDLNKPPAKPEGKDRKSVV